MGRFLTRLLALFGISITTVACYGTPYEEYNPEFGTSGRVVDDYGNGIIGIEVTAGDEVSTSGTNGRFFLSNAERVIAFRDVDGQQNGGEFEERTITLREGVHDVGVVVMYRKSREE